MGDVCDVTGSESLFPGANGERFSIKGDRPSKIRPFETAISTLTWTSSSSSSAFEVRANVGQWCVVRLLVFRNLLL